MQIETKPLDWLGPDYRASLEKLARWLIERADAINFSMYTYAETTLGASLDPEDVTIGEDAAGSKDLHPCGTVACAAGHGPLAGLPAVEGESWNQYIERTFGINVFESRGDDLFDWLFSSIWMRTDNTARGAGQRILWTLHHGIPLNADDQRYGDAPLCYVEA